IRKSLFPLFAVYAALQLGNSLFPNAASVKEAASIQIQLTDTTLTTSNLPIVVINTGGQIILDSVKIMADMGIIDNGAGKRNSVTDPFNGYNGKIGIELRGWTSQSFPKKPYGFETRNSDGSNLDVSLLGMPADNDWILFAPYDDKSLIRDALLYSLSNKIGMYATRTRYCELMLNGQYQGIYVLMEKVKRGKNRVDVSKLEAKDSTGTALTGGYIILHDHIEFNKGGWYSCYPPYIGSQPRLFLQYYYPKPEDIIPQQKSYIQQFMKEFEKTLYNSGYDDPVNGYVKYINTGSFIDYMILTELCKNVDGYRLSTYLHKNSDSKDGRLVMGPPWDYNIAFGNANYDEGQYTNGWQLDWPWDVYHDQIPFWFRRLLMDKSFANKLHNRWTELRKGALSYNSITAQIDSFTVLLKESKDRNFRRWPVLGQYVWPNYFIGQTYESEINYLKSWIKGRLAWLDANMYGQQTAEVAQTNAQSQNMSFRLEQNFPNPFNPETTIGFSLEKAGNVNLSIYNILGRKVKTLINEMMGEGTHKVVWKGVDDSGRRVPSGVYFYRLESNGNSFIKRMILLQ
ncbi:MAG: CotH kinase family protein, partial [Bacteroidota bacterium]|nr:CotH kinase family protein [Bacteroidota bacterium]